MTQTVANDFERFRNVLNNFIGWLNKFRDERSSGVFESNIENLLTNMEIQLGYYSDMEYKVRFIEWVSVKLISAINQKKSHNKDIKEFLINQVRVIIKNKFETILVSYPFILDDHEYINWKWSYREIIAVLYSLKQFGAFNEETAEYDMSNLKDLIFRSGFKFNGKIDVENSYRDTITAWKRIFGEHKKILDEDREPTNDAFAATEVAGMKKLSEYAKKLQVAISHIDSQFQPK